MFCESDMDIFHKLEIDATQFTRTAYAKDTFPNCKHYLQDIVREAMCVFRTQAHMVCVTELLGDHPGLAGATADIADDRHDVVGRVMYFLTSLRTAPFRPHKFRPRPEILNPLDIPDPKDQVFALAYDFIGRIYTNDPCYARFLRLYAAQDLQALDVNLGFHIKYWPFWFVYFYSN